MKTSVIEVRDMLSVLSVPGVEERIAKVPGVESATVNFAAGSATVRYDETRLEIADIRSAVRQGGYEADAAPAASDGGLQGNALPGAAPATPAAAVPKAPSAAPAAEGAASPGAAPSKTPGPSPGAPSDGPEPAPEVAAPAGDSKARAAPSKH